MKLTLDFSNKGERRVGAIPGCYTRHAIDRISVAYNASPAFLGPCV